MGDVIIRPLANPVKQAVSAPQAVPKNTGVVTAIDNMNKALGVTGPILKGALDAAEKRTIFDEIKTVAETEDNIINAAEQHIQELAVSLGGPPTAEEQKEYFQSLDKLERIKAAAKQRMTDGTALSYTIAKGREMILAGKNPDVVRKALTVFTTGLSSNAGKKEELPKFEKDTRNKWYAYSRGKTDYSSPEYLAFREREFDLADKKRRVDEGAVDFSVWSSDLLDVTTEEASQALFGLATQVSQTNDPNTALEILTAAKQELVAYFSSAQARMTDYIAKSAKDGRVISNAERNKLQASLFNREKQTMNRIDSLIRATNDQINNKGSRLKQMAEALHNLSSIVTDLKTTNSQFALLTSGMTEGQVNLMTQIFDTQAARLERPDDMAIQARLNDLKLKGTQLGIPQNVLNTVTPEMVQRDMDALVLLSSEDFLQDALRGGHIPQAVPVARRYLNEVYSRNRSVFLNALATQSVSNNGQPINRNKDASSPEPVPSSSFDNPEGSDSWKGPNIIRSFDNAVATEFEALVEPTEFFAALNNKDTEDMFIGLLKAKKNGAVMNEYNMWKTSVNKFYTLTSRVLDSVEPVIVEGPRTYTFRLNPKTLTVTVDTTVTGGIPFNGPQVLPDKVQKQLSLLNNMLAVLEKGRPFTDLYDFSKAEMVKRIGTVLNTEKERTERPVSKEEVFMKALEDGIQ